MSLLDRLRLLTKAEWNARRTAPVWVPETERRSLVREGRAALASALAEEARWRRAYQDALDEAQRYEEAAEGWLRRGNEENARAFLRRRQDTLRHAQALRLERDRAHELATELRGTLATFEQRFPIQDEAPPPATNADLFRTHPAQQRRDPPAPGLPGEDRERRGLGSDAPPQGAWREGGFETVGPGHYPPPSPGVGWAPPDAGAGPSSGRGSWDEAGEAPTGVAFARAHAQWSETQQRMDAWERSIDERDALAEVDRLTAPPGTAASEDPAMEARFRALELEAEKRRLRQRAAREDGDGEGG